MVLELSHSGKIVSKCHLNILPRVQDALPVSKALIMRNYEGDLLQVRIISFTESVAEP